MFLLFYSPSIFIFSTSFIPTIIITVSFFLLTLGLVFSYCSSWLRFKVRLLSWALSSLTQVFKAINFYLSTALATSHKFWYVLFLFSFIPKHLWIFLVISYLAHWLFSNVLLNFHKSVYFLLLLISNFILFWRLCFLLFLLKFMEICFTA